jgi:hypothetical protein
MHVRHPEAFPRKASDQASILRKVVSQAERAEQVAVDDVRRDMLEHRRRNRLYHGLPRPLGGERCRGVAEAGREQIAAETVRQAGRN